MYLNIEVIKNRLSRKKRKKRMNIRKGRKMRSEINKGRSAPLRQ